LPGFLFLCNITSIIHTLHLFPLLDQKLLEVLRSLDPIDWNKPTLARQWTVKDIAAHLLDGNIRTIAMIRDHHLGEGPVEIHSYQDLVNHLNHLNADWVKALKRMSPGMLIELLELTGKHYYEALTSLDPKKPALFSVAWAGQNESPNWFHIAREYTEKWHHQQQIRDAVKKHGIMTKEFFFPVMDTFMQALPYAYRNTPATNGTFIHIVVTSAIGGKWILVRHEDRWKLTQKSTTPQAEILIDPDTTWKLFTKGISAQQVDEKIQFTGNPDLVKPVLSMLAVMA
jgi:uncharacterized protein (TIGR03083 family)